MTIAPHVYEFGTYRLDVPARRLLRDGEPISLTPKAFDILLALIERRDRVVDKTELMRLVWPDSFVEEANLSQTIFVLRKTLGEDGRGGHFIETSPRRGYRFSAPVRVDPRETAVIATASKLEPTTPHAPPDHLRQGYGGPPKFYAKAESEHHVRDYWRVARWIAGTAAAIVVAISASGMLPVGRVRTTTEALLADKTRIAVLPIENLSGDSTQDYFADGLTEEMITQLSQLRPERLAVIARTSAMTYKGTRKSAAEIGRQLNADYILEWSMRREGRRLRVSSRLVRVSDQTHVWAENYEREVHEVLALQGEVSRAIAAGIGIELTEASRAGLTASASISPEAYEDYLKGRFFWNKMTPEGLQKAIGHFEAAIRRNPEYAAAYSGMADSYANLGLWGLPGQEALRKAKAAADEAIAIRESLAEGHASRAFIAMAYDLDWSTAEREFKRALELNPGYAFAHHRYGYLLMLMGRWQESETELKRAQELDPLSMIINANIGFRLYMMRQYDAAIAHWNKNLEMDPNFMLLHDYKGMAYVMKGAYAEAITNFEKGLSISGANASQVGAIGYIYGVMGRRQEAQRELARLLELAKHQFVPAFYVALLYTGLGDKDQAFAWLDRAYEERSGYLMEIHVDPMFDPLRSDSRFQLFVQRLGLEATSPVRHAAVSATTLRAGIPSRTAREASR